MSEQLERPVARRALPVRVYSNGQGVRYIEYFTIRNGQKVIEKPVEIGRPDDLSAPLAFHLGHAWYACIQAYYELEATINGVLKERDDARAAVAAAEGRVADVEKLLMSEKARTSELKRQRGKDS